MVVRDSGACFALLCWGVCVGYWLELPPRLVHTEGVPPWRPEHSFGERLGYICGYLVLFCALHACVKRALPDASTAFYLNHTVTNALITAMVFQDVVHTLTDPLYSMMREYSLQPTYIQLCFHLSHCIMEYKTLTKMDWGHHLLSSSLVGILNIYYTYGPLLNYAMFFATGFPGGVDYFLLYLVKRGLIHSMTEKRINRHLNMVIRMPGLIVWMAFAHVCMRHETSARAWLEPIDPTQREMSLTALLTMYLFIAGNALFFADRVVGNYHVRMHMTAGKK